MFESAPGRLAAVAVGGMLGSVARYWIAGIAQRWSGSAFPLGTLAVNVLGSFVVGLVICLSLERGLVGASGRLFLAVGVCGGFTTMSTFSYETIALVGEGSVAAAFGNVAVSLALCLAATWLGIVAGRLL